MENSLVRSAMSVQRSSNPERKDVTQCYNHGYTQRPQRQILCGQIRGGRRTRKRRETHTLCDEGDAFSDEVLSDARQIFPQAIDSTISKPCESFLHAAAQLQLLPGSKGFINDVTSESFPSWDFVAQVICRVDEPMCCPICLYPPVAPRMERCGHVYCGPCITKYIRYENDGATKKCAVCCWVIRLEELKRVSIIQVTPVKVGSKISMNLVNCAQSENDQHANLSSVALPTSTSQTLSFIVEMEEAQLRSATQQEISLLEAFKSTCIDDGEVELIPEINYMVDQLQSSLKGIVSSFQHVSPVGSGDISPGCVTVDSGHGSVFHDRTYQAADGQLIFLDGLMWRCLLAEYDAVTDLPQTIDVTISSMKTYKMNSVLRRRWRHLKRVPSGHVFRLIEIELDNLVSKATLEQFASALEARSIERDRSRLEDLRLTKLKEAAENRIPSIPEGFKLSGHEPLLDGPCFQPSDFVPLGAIAESIPKASTSAPSFAEVSKMGALSIVDRNRVANFARGPISRRSIPSFNPNSEAWPSLSDANKQISDHAPLLRSATSASPWDLSSTLGVAHDSPTNTKRQDTAPKSNLKRHRRRRIRTDSLPDPSL